MKDRWNVWIEGDGINPDVEFQVEADTLREAQEKAAEHIDMLWDEPPGEKPISWPGTRFTRLPL